MFDYQLVLQTAKKAQRNMSSEERKTESKKVAKKMPPILILVFFVGSLTSSLVMSSAQSAVQKGSQLLNLLSVGAEDTNQAVYRKQAFLF